MVSNSILFFFLEAGGEWAVLVSQARFCVPLWFLSPLNKLLYFFLLCLREFPVWKEEIFLRNSRCSYEPALQTLPRFTHPCEPQ